MAQQIQLRNDSAAAWEAENPVLAQAEVGVNTTTGQFKIGDGTSTWEELEYYAGGSANVADFVFLDDGGDGSFMTVTDHDMTIRTLRDEDSVGSDCDINIEAADDVFIRAYGDEVGLYAANELNIRTNNYRGDGTENEPVNGVPQEWTFRTDGRIEFPDGTIQTTGNIRPAADFLTWGEGTTHLPDLNTHFGWNSNGLWFQNADESDGATSYPVFTDFTIPEDSSVVVEFIFDANTECNNIGVCVYSDGDNPEWDYATNSSRIAAQFDCFDLKLFGRTTSAAGDVGIPESGLYRVRFAYDPTASTNKVTVSYTAQGSDEVIESLSINEALPAGPYRIGFAADQDSDTTKTYMTYLSINVDNDDQDQGDDNYGADLDTGNSGTTSDTDLVLPVAIKDGEGDDFITFTRTSTGTARIATPQDDLSLRSARDITLFPGSDGDGNVYIGWGDAELTPDATNRVATIGDVQAATGLGDITFDGVKITGAGTASGDGLGAGTMELVPDADLYANDQYLVIDPTDPNHIHIRAGGEIDESIAKVIIGGERNHVYVSDSAREVSIRTRPTRIENTYQNLNETSNAEFITSMPVNIEVGYKVNVESTDFEIAAVTLNSPTEGLATVTATGLSFVTGDTYTFTYDPTYDNFWEFGSNGYLYGPGMGGLLVQSVANYENDLYVSSDQDVIIQGGNEGGEFLGSATSSDNQIATIGDIRKYYGAFYHTETVELTSATTAYSVPLNSTAETLGVSVVSNSRITVDNAGVYNIQFSLQLDKTDGGDDLVNVWLSKNNANVAWSNTQFEVVGGGGKYVAALNFVLTLAANDYVELKVQSPDTHMRIVASGTQTTPDRPAVPSSIVTVTQVS
jgi:hypothetical protein